ncbi:EF-hand domain-containing protein [Bordetella sp. BOR01]|uniref:HvfA family oxazolone/thioamide-modified RiPP metallophore n=1 Tax=Bordetella sp. BOR01 TaxID=2854779 RepID=UPI001C4959CA|nr:EF-hand domain-containing protein [Bordetella sp. BOR01]MBV7483106.1 EF-hand domain-containing protein [Bordetella sp. BOR01]
MSSITTSPRKTALGMIGAVLAGSVLLSGSAFAMQPLAQGYLVAAGDAQPAEGKCGEGKCGGDVATTAGSGSAKSTEAEGKCGEGKCGEGKCGDASFAKTDADGDGFVSRAEFLKVAPTRADQFAKLDTDGDGRISELEAHEYLRVTYAAHGKPMPKGLFSKIPD